MAHRLVDLRIPTTQRGSIQNFGSDITRSSRSGPSGVDLTEIFENEMTATCRR